jgi:surface protein
MSGMFSGCIQFNQPLNHWDVSNVKNMQAMFAGCFHFNQPLDNWNDKLSNVTDMQHMFYSCRSFDQNLSGWTLNQNVLTDKTFDDCLISQANMPLVYKMLRNTNAIIQTVRQNDLIPGHTYLIQHNSEGSQNLRFRRASVEGTNNNIHTRFIGKFIGILTMRRAQRMGDKDQKAALFEDVEIKNINKSQVTDDVFVISTINEELVSKTLRDTESVKQMTQDIRNNANYKLAFDLSQWSFAESNRELNRAIIKNTLDHISNDDPNPNDPIKQQYLTKLRGDVLSEGVTSSIIEGYVGNNFKFPKASEKTKQRRIEDLENKTKRKFDMKGGKSRKGKSRKSKSRKSRSKK